MYLASVMRRWMRALLVFGLVGTIAELLLLQHYEDILQFVPLVLIGVALVVLVWHGFRPCAANLRVLRITMVLFLAAGFLGVVLHYRGAAQFQKEIDPSQPTWDIFKKAVKAKDPPVLAPGLMLQLGFIGLLYGHLQTE